MARKKGNRVKSGIVGAIIGGLLGGPTGAGMGALIGSSKAPNRRKRPAGLPQGWKWPGDRRGTSKPRRKIRF